MIGDATLRQILVGNLPLYAGRKGQTPFATHAFITEFYNASAARIAGGSQIIAEQLIQQLEQLGGKVLTRQTRHGDSLQPFPSHGSDHH